MNAAIKSSAMENVLPLKPAPRARPPKYDNHRFRIKEFANESGTHSYRVDGYKRDGTRVRENYADLKDAQCRQVELMADYLSRQPEDTSIRATRLSEVQVRIAESAFVRLGKDEDMLLAVEHWLRDGRQHAVSESPRLDEAFQKFAAWLDTECPLRDLSRKNLKRRVNVFINSSQNMLVSDVRPDTIDAYLAKRNVSSKSKDNDRRAVSRFFSWCIERPRRWTTGNPCREVRVTHGEEAPPAILTLGECEALLRKAEKFEKGRLAAYVAVCLFAGLRPFEAARLTWNQVNLTDGEIRLEGNQTKTGKGRVVAICPTLKAWLHAHKNKPFFPSNWRKDFDKVKLAAGFGTPDDKSPNLRPWPVDVMRHTAISHYFRDTGSYGKTAEQFGNSEAIIKNHYQGRVNSEDTKNFYALLPTKKGGRK